MTNYERIKNMTAEQVAHEIVEVLDKAGYRFCGDCEWRLRCGETPCEKMILNWLESEADDRCHYCPNCGAKMDDGRKR